MARITSQRAVEALGGDRFLLILVASQRARELAAGSTPRVEAKGNNWGIIALREIEAGKYTKEEYYQTIRG